MPQNPNVGNLNPPIPKIPNTPVKKTLKQIIAEEYLKCSLDPVHFMKKYCMIQHPVRGKIAFHLYPFQEKTLNEFKNNRFNIVLKSRQTGISTLSAGYALWRMIFNSDFNVLVIATKQDVAKNLVTKVRIMHELLPSWLKGGSLEDNKLSLRLNNGSQIKAIASSPDAGRSEALSLLIFDEAAFINDIDEIWTSAQSTLSTGGSCIALSTPNGVGGWFHKTWIDAEEGRNPFNCIKLHWTVHPERDQSWRDEQESLLGRKKASQECLDGNHVVTVRDEFGVVSEKKLSELYNLVELTNKYEILTPDGYRKFEGVEKRVKSEYVKLYLSDGNVVKCSTNHVFISNGVEKKAKDLSFYDVIDTFDNTTVVVNDTELISQPIELFDIIGVDESHLFVVENLISHNCDCSFVSSGDTVIDPEILQFYKETYIQDPIIKDGIDGNLWRWEYPDYTKSYMVVADVARGDGADFSAAHVIDIANAAQVAEYKGKIDTKEFGNFLVGLATEYNDALLVVENANIGWACIQQIIDRSYKNLFYMSTDLKYIDVERQLTNRYRVQERGLVAGFSTTSKTRPLIISKLDEYFKDSSVTIRSQRLIDELFTFIYVNGRAEAMHGYHDDLVMSFSIALWVRDTALRLRQQGIDLTKQAIGGIVSNNYEGVYGGTSMTDDVKRQWSIDLGNGETEDLTGWL